MVWQPGAAAQFDGAGGSVDVASSVTASNLTFATGGYTLGGLGLLTLEGGLAAAAATENTVSAELRSHLALTKTGDGAVTLANPDALLTNGLAVSAGTIALQGTAIPGAVSVASGAALSALPPAATGLLGFYYNVVPNGANFASLDVMEAHFASLVPDLVASSGLVGANFDFGSTGTLFPLPYAYNSGASRTNNFEVVWRGTLTVPTSATYVFRITHDDGILLALDGLTVANRLANSVTDGTAYLTAGAHDMVLGLYQGTGPSAMQIQVRSLYGSFAPLPNAWLSPYASVGALSGAGSATLTASGSALRSALDTAATFAGALAGPAGSRFTKAGWGPLTLASPTTTSNALAGDVAVEGGVLALATDERIGDSSTVLIAPNSGLAVAASGSLSMRVLIHNSGHTCHLYGLSNEQSAAPAAPSAPAASYPRAVAFTDDADSGLSAAKTYTHLLDIPANGNPATVNGVDFLAAGLSGSANGYSWSVTAGTAPTGAWNDSQGVGNDSARTGVDRLLWDFMYNSTDYTLTLAGLAPGRTYETRLYFRSFGGVGTDTPRDVTFTFTAGASLLGSVAHDLDTLARSRVECRYTADAAGTVSIRVYSINSGSSCHLYGLSNEEVNEPSVLTLDTPAATAARHTGGIAGQGTLIKRGAGTQSLGGVSRLSTALQVQEGTLALEPGASLLAGASVAAGATLAAPYGGAWLGGLSGAGTFSLAGQTLYPVTNLLGVTYFTNDLMTGISPAKTYTHLMDLGTRANVAVINGVTFTKVSSQNGSAGGYGWANFPPNPHPGNVPPADHGVPAGTGIYDLLYDMDYGWSYPSPQTMQLTGLIPGKRYEVHLFNRAWGWNGSRTQTVTFDPDGAGPITEAITFNPDAMNANYVAYRYTAVSTTLAITVLSAQNNQTLHLYGLTNEEIADAAYEPVVVDLAADGTFDGLVTGAGAWAKTGAGALTLTATNDATGALAVNAGALGVAGGGTATLGSVSVAAGATLFGDGAVGGNVTVASNATLRADTAAACGTLAIGGNLTLAAGALTVWRYASGAADAITVGGRLALPTNGVLQVASLTSGLRPPTKVPVFASAQTIDGPVNLQGWTVEGADKARLIYSPDRKIVYFLTPRGAMVLIR